ncbi:class I SAM-dependent methyltransferase [Marinoscillum sp.]|uniref:class I SAM-dependent methyltransferase n=1 Tax=Marinoscillum sp. TaxID=2024838 RepID=UPI003BACE073
MKDLFSEDSSDYASFRPSYPTDLINYIRTLVPESAIIWECGAGSGQMTRLLAPHFHFIHATDISQPQLDMAPTYANVHYTKQRAEHTNFPNQSFHMVIAAQAAHWFDFDTYYNEVRRVLKRSGLVVLTGYGLLRVEPFIDEAIDRFYTQLGPFWEPERKHIDLDYQSIPFPFEELSTPAFSYRTEWSIEHCMAYLQTWSAFRKMSKEEKISRLADLKSKLLHYWQGSKVVTFPTLLRVGYLR